MLKKPGVHSKERIDSPTRNSASRNCWVGFAFCSEIFLGRAYELGDPVSNRNSPLIGIETLRALGTTLLPLIESAAKDGTLSNAPNFYNIARCWKYFGRAGHAKAWISAGVHESPSFLAKVALGMVVYSVSTRGRVYQMGERPDEDLYDLDQLLAACRKHLAGEKFNSDESNRVRTIADGIECLLAERTPKTESAH